jgi:hypothetical protein
MVDAHGNPTGHVVIGKQKSVTFVDVAELIKANNAELLKSLRPETPLKTQPPATVQTQTQTAITVKPEQHVTQKPQAKLPQPKSSEDEFLEFITGASANNEES